MNRSEKNRLIGSALGIFIGLTLVDWDQNDFAYATETSVLAKNLSLGILIPSVVQSLISLFKSTTRD